MGAVLPHAWSVLQRSARLLPGIDAVDHERSRSLLAHSRVPRPHSWLYTRWELRLSGIANGRLKVRILSTAWTAFTKTSALWEASCCCTLPVPENFRRLRLCHCVVSALNLSR